MMLLSICSGFVLPSFGVANKAYAEEGEKFMTLEISLRVKDEDGARWMHNETPRAKGLYIDFGGTCNGCQILYPRKYRTDASEVNIPAGSGVWFIPQEGILRFDVPQALNNVSVTLVDPAGNSVAIETDNGIGNDTAEGRRTQTLTLEKDNVNTVGAFQSEILFFVTEDTLQQRLVIGSIPVGGVSVYDQIVTNTGQFFRRAAAMLGWSLEITDAGFDNIKINDIALIVRDIVNGIIILAILGLAVMWVFSALIPAQTMRQTTALVFMSAIICNFAVPAVKLLLDGAQVVQATFLTREVTEDKFLRIENISDVWVGTGQKIIQPKTYRDGDQPVTDFQDYQDRYVDMRQESTLFHSLLLFVLACGEILIAVVLVLRIIILWFFLILAPFFAVLPIFRFSRSVFRYWFWLFGRWLFLGPLIAMCIFISISLWQHTGIPIESSFEGFAGTAFLANTTNIQMYAPGVIHSEGGNMGSATELMKFIAGILMVWYSVIVPFWLTRSKLLPDSCCGSRFEARGKNRGGRGGQAILAPPSGPNSPTALLSSQGGQPIGYTPTGLAGGGKEPKFLKGFDKDVPATVEMNVPKNLIDGAGKEEVSAQTASTATANATQEQQNSISAQSQSEAGQEQNMGIMEESAVQAASAAFSDSQAAETAAFDQESGQSQFAAETADTNTSATTETGQAQFASASAEMGQSQNATAEASSQTQTSQEAAQVGSIEASAEQLQSSEMEQGAEFGASQAEAVSSTASAEVSAETEETAYVERGQTASAEQQQSMEMEQDTSAFEQASVGTSTEASSAIGAEETSDMEIDTSAPTAESVSQLGAEGMEAADDFSIGSGSQVGTEAQMGAEGSLGEDDDIYAERGSNSSVGNEQSMAAEVESDASASAEGTAFASGEVNVESDTEASASTSSAASSAIGAEETSDMEIDTSAPTAESISQLGAEGMEAADDFSIGSGSQVGASAEMGSDSSLGEDDDIYAERGSNSSVGNEQSMAAEVESDASASAEGTAFASGEVNVESDTEASASTSSAASAAGSTSSNAGALREEESEGGETTSAGNTMASAETAGSEAGATEQMSTGFEDSAEVDAEMAMNAGVEADLEMADNTARVSALSAPDDSAEAGSLDPVSDDAVDTAMQPKTELDFSTDIDTNINANLEASDMSALESQTLDPTIEFNTTLDQNTPTSDLSDEEDADNEIVLATEKVGSEEEQSLFIPLESDQNNGEKFDGNGIESSEDQAAATSSEEDFEHEPKMAAVESDDILSANQAFEADVTTNVSVAANPTRDESGQSNLEKEVPEEEQEIEDFGDILLEKTDEKDAQKEALQPLIAQQSDEAEAEDEAEASDEEEENPEEEASKEDSDDEDATDDDEEAPNEDNEEENAQDESATDESEEDEKALDDGAELYGESDLSNNSSGSANIFRKN